MSWQGKLLIAGLRALKSFPGRRAAPIEQQRRRLRLLESIVPGPPAGTQTTCLDADGVPAVEIKVRQARADRCVIYFHGGGYVVGSAPLFRDFTWRIGAAARARVLYFDYRLAPENPFPAAVEDAHRVFRWVTGRIDPARIAFIGDSAGGGLALGTLHKLRDEGAALPAAMIAISPLTDLALTGLSLRENAGADPTLDAGRLPYFVGGYLGGADPRNPYASPLYGDAYGLPPTLFQVGADEILRDDSVRLAERMRAAGGKVELEVWPQMPHAWHLYARILPEGRRAIARIAEFLQDYL